MNLRNITASLFLTAALAAPVLAGRLTDSLTPGSPKLQSAGPLAFGPEGILFVADAKAAVVFAIATGDTKPQTKTPSLNVAEINNKIASVLGTGPDQILINDLVVNPISKNAYLAVSRGRGPDASPVLIRVSAPGKVEVVSLRNVAYAKAALPDAPVDEETGEGRRRRNPRTESITDLGFVEDRVLIAGLSNEEFASSLRVIPFPFKNVAKGTSVEIYHGAHGRFETRSPVRTFVPYEVDDQPHLLAAYTCTPLVQFPLSDLKPGAKIRGKTVAELGNRNRPLDMIVYSKGDSDYLLIANSSRGIMKVSTDRIENAESITDRVGGGGTKGLSYETIEAWSGVDQLDKLDGEFALLIRRGDDGALNLETRPLP